MQLFYQYFLPTYHHQISWVSSIYIFSLLFNFFPSSNYCLQPLHATEIVLGKAMKCFLIRGWLFYSVTTLSISLKPFVPSWLGLSSWKFTLPLCPWCCSVQILFTNLWPFFLFCPSSSKGIITFCFLSKTSSFMFYLFLTAAG